MQHVIKTKPLSKAFRTITPLTISFKRDLSQTKTISMKIQIILFLTFWFNSLFAPELSNTKEQKLNLTKSSYIEYVISPEEIFSDSVDINTIKYYKMTKIFGTKERRKVREIARDLGIKTKWLYNIFYIECTGNIHKLNPYSNAVGLIGFLPSTAIKLGTTTEQLQQMSVYEQLDYVHKYFKLVLPNKKMKKAADVYLAIFSPCDIHKHDSTIIGKNRKKDISALVYKQNKILDIDKDSVISIKDINLFVSLL